MSQIELNLIVLYSSNPRELAIWYGKVLGQTVNEEKHGKGPLHYSIQLGESVVEFYPQKHERLSAPMTFGLRVNADQFENFQITTKYRMLNESSLIIHDPDKNQIMVQKSSV